VNKYITYDNLSPGSFPTFLSLPSLLHGGGTYLLVLHASAGSTTSIGSIHKLMTPKTRLQVRLSVLD